MSAPRYPVGPQLRPGMPDEDWIRFCVRCGKDGYRWCAPVPCVRAYAGERKEQGARLFVLTTSQTSFETLAKEEFIRRHYPGLFEQVIAVAKDELKLPVMCAMAEQCGVQADELELVEDTYALVLAADRLGIRATHVSQIISGTADCCAAE